MANALTRRFNSQVVLLHVFARTPPAAARSRFAQERLESLARSPLRPAIDSIGRVRVGKPGPEILAEAALDRSELILLPALGPPWWKRPFRPGYGATTRRVATEASCRVLVVDFDRRVDCLRRWMEDPSQSWAA